ncbi:MAG: LTA synthase family protein [Candidatus Delongbacteria bacterium]|nr:LTA synthase family protein [Candidatus Delongbacteria bacterium]MBN2836300.1 LTA synthase family protein [Candidatus Delongbacteria bacterium]
MKNILDNQYLQLFIKLLFLMFLYSLTRFLFYLFNVDLFPSITPSKLITAMWGGLKFDLTAILYINLLYLFLYLLPHPYRYNNFYLKLLKIIFIVTNSIGLALNCIDFIYYRFLLKRTTISVFTILENESNYLSLAKQIAIDFWYVVLIWIIIVFVIYKFINYIKVTPFLFKKKVLYYPVSIILLLLFSYLTVAGIRGGFAHSTRPITLSNAGKYVDNPEEMAIVLNTPFALIRTFDKKPYKKTSFLKEDEALNYFNPVKNYTTNLPMNKKNVMIIIWESLSREYVGELSRLNGNDFEGYTPFLDSLIQNSLVFVNSYANGKKSIDAMPSVLASIPALVEPYILSEYSSNDINSLASILNLEGYNTSFFHGAPNGSMGFESFAKLAKFKNYYGKTEYNNDSDFDGIWGIWDHKFLRYWGETISKEISEPFFSACFTLSSHHPYKVPNEFDNILKEGLIKYHKPISYTDLSLKLFFESIKNETWFKNTIFVITADHCSGRAYYEEFKNSMDHFAIPIIFYTPDGSLKGTRYDIAQQTDIMPTILSFLNYSGEFVSFGNNLNDSTDIRFAANYKSNAYQLTTDSTFVQIQNKNKIKRFHKYNNHSLVEAETLDTDNSENLLKSIIQQYNNRMITNNLIIREDLK